MTGYNPNTYPYYQCDEEDDSGTPPEEQEAAAVVQTDEQPPTPEQQRMTVAERFFWRWVASESAECAIESIAELISYGGDLDEIMRKMAL